MSEPGPVRLFWGRALVTVGILWCVLCGGCTLYFSLQMFGSAYPPEVAVWFLLCGVVGAICALPGAAFLLIGHLILRRKR